MCDFFFRSWKLSNTDSTSLLFFNGSEVPKANDENLEVSEISYFPASHTPTSKNECSICQFLLPLGFNTDNCLSVGTEPP